VVSADPLSRAGLAALLAGRADLSVAGQAAPDGELRSAIEAADPGAAVWDLGGGSSGLDRLRQAAEGGLPVLALLSAAGQAQEALSAGAGGALPRGAPADRIAAALRAVAAGLLVLDAGSADELLRPAPAAPAEGLTPRELEVLSLLAEGLSNKAIAERLGISDHTAKFHVNAILGKLGAGSRSEAIVRAARLGLVVL
jgi:DNA-binding NarL/FixJ family response regulator